MGLPKPSLPDNFRNELARLVRAGFPLLPLGGGADGKAPLVREWAGPKMALARVLAPLYRSGSLVYGIRLDGLLVIDCDTDCAELVAALEARFGPSTVHVKTPRGRHLYYLATGKAPNLRAEGLPVDIKTGPRAYVAGPWSIRPDGGTYSPAKGLLGVDPLPPLHLTDTAANRPLGETFSVGHRHAGLVREAMKLLEFVDSAEELEANLAAVRDDLCADPTTMPGCELRAIAGWAWEMRLENRIFRGRDSAFSVHRLALDALRQSDNDTDAIGLFILLTDMHGHIPGKRFALDFNAMREAKLTRLSVTRLRAARRTLVKVGLLKLVGKHLAGSIPQTFVLARLRPDLTDAPNITPLPISKPAAPKGKQGGKAKIKYDDRIRTHKSFPFPERQESND
jgi:hypothetical protein